MSSIQVIVTDATGSRSDDVELPGDAPVIQVVAALINALKLPLSGPDGQPMSYRFHHMQTGMQLRDDATLLSSGVADGHTLRLVPEITAG